VAARRNETLEQKFERVAAKARRSFERKARAAVAEQHVAVVEGVATAARSFEAFLDGLDAALPDDE